jgi:Zn-dependent oligopeptidase
MLGFGFRTQPNKGPWIVTLKRPIYKSFLEYCPEAAVRWNAWNAYNTRASGYTEKIIDNSVHMEDIRMRRFILHESFP